MFKLLFGRSSRDKRCSARHRSGGFRPQLVTLENRDVPAGIDLYTATFDQPADIAPGVSAAWSHHQQSVTPVGARHFLGEFGNQTVTLSLGNLPIHSALTVSFDVYVIRSWDGSDVLNKWGPDGWSFGIDGATLLSTSFSNQPLPSPGSANNRQTFGGINIPSGDYPAFAGATEVNTLGYTFYRSSYQQVEEMSSVYRLTFDVAHADSTVQLTFRGFGLQRLSDESWGLDNVTVRTNPTLTLLGPPDPVVVHVGAPAQQIFWDTVFDDPDLSATYSAASSDADVVAVDENPGSLGLQFSATQPGSATVTMIATSPNGESVTTSFPVFVLPQGAAQLLGEPVTDVGAPYTVVIDPHGESPEFWQLNWGDGHSTVVPGGPDPISLTHTFAAEGQPIIELIAVGAGFPPGGALRAVLVLNVLDAQQNPAMWRVEGVRKAEGNAGQTAFDFKVKMLAATNREIKIKYRTIDGTAVAGTDYVAASGELTFAAGETEKTVTVQVTGDAVVEPDEEFFLVLEIPALTDGKPSSALTPFGRGLIVNDDGVPANDPWSSWVEVQLPHSPDTVPQSSLGQWRKSVDGNTTTITTPQGPSWTATATQSPALTGEGPYLKYNGGENPDAIKSFRLTVEWQAKDEKPVSPMPKGEQRPIQQQHSSNSGIYIYDRYEVQIIDPSKFTAGIMDGTITGVGAELKDQLLPGGVYGTAQQPVPPAVSYTNRAKPTGEWNTMIIEFDPGTVDPDNAKKLSQPAWIKVTLNGEVVYKAELKVGDVNLTGTGSRSNTDRFDPQAKGAIFLQSHWGSQVEFRNPVVEEVPINRN